MERNPTGLYQANVTLRVRLMVVASDVGSAQEVARTAICARTGVATDEIHGIQILPMSAVDHMELSNIVSWQELEALRTHGTADDRSRWMQNIMPDSELIAIAKRETFRPLATFPQHRRTGFADIDHPKNSNGLWKCLLTWRSGPANIVELATLQGPDLTGKLTTGEREALVRIQECAEDMRDHPWLRVSRRFVGNPVSLQVREHRCTCRSCGRSISRRTVLVTVSWAGRYLDAEYIL